MSKLATKQGASVPSNKKKLPIQNLLGSLPWEDFPGGSGMGHGQHALPGTGGFLAELPVLKLGEF